MQNNSLGRDAAFQLSNVVKTPPQYGALTPRWITRFLSFIALETGAYRVNKASGEVFQNGQGFIEYETKPREYRLDAISAVINIDTRAADLYGAPFDQTAEQIKLASESLKERQESELINNADYGLLKNAALRVAPRGAAPTPDDFDELLTMVWKEPTFFLAHPRGVAAFLRECTRRGVPPATVNMSGGTFVTWRGIPIVPTDKLFIENEKTNILLIRAGENKRGAVGLYQANTSNGGGLAVRFRGVNDDGLASYLLSIYCSAAILADDAVAVLENVEVGKYHEYKWL
jgi:hypothetical protein